MTAGLPDVRHIWFNRVPFRKQVRSTALQGWFALSKRYISIAAVAVVLAVVALIGYVWPAPEPLLPVKPLPDRVLLENTAGKVVFDHKKHFEDYKVECQDCHHDRDKPTPIAQACTSCHGAVDKPGFKTAHVTAFKDQMSCVTCHHVEFAGTTWDHDGHTQLVDGKCATCHHDDQRSQPAPQKCSTCHELAAQGAKPGLADAVHARCSTPDCHGDLFPADGDMKQCGVCHNLVNTKTTLFDKGWVNINPAYADCTVCHVGQTIDDLILPRMQAFHESCMGCHEKLHKGPYGQDSCNQCHTK